MDLGLQCAPPSTGIDLTGPYIQGQPGSRLTYLSLGTLDEAHAFTRFRREKLQLDAIPPAVPKAPWSSVCSWVGLDLTDAKGAGGTEP